jgi:hypothetical protein
MATKVRTISVNLSAGTAKFFTDLDAASGKIRQFGQHGVSSVQATSGALRTLEGNFGNNIRAVERFIATTLGLGPALQAAFPIIGAVAFAGLIGEISQKTVKFFKDMAEAPERIAGAFRGISEPLRLTNDELRVANDRLANDIAKLEGRPENGLKLALDEARVAADRLGDALDRDLSALNKVLKESEPNFAQKAFRWLGGINQPDLAKEFGGDTGFGGFTGRIDAITSRGQQAIAQAPDLTAEKEARRQMNKELADEYGKQLEVIAQRLGAIHDGKISIGTMGQTQGVSPVYIESLQHLQRVLQEQQAYVALQSKNTDLTGTKTGLEADKANSRQGAEARRRSQEETNRLLQELAAATEKNLTVWDAINLKQQEMTREALAANVANVAPGIVGPGVVPKEQVDLIQQITDQARIEAGTKALEEYRKGMLAVEGEWEKLQAKRDEEKVKLLYPAADMKHFAADERYGNTQWNADREAATRQAGFADRMAELGGGSQESKINDAYQRRIELANELKAVEQQRIDAELDLETKIHLMQEQQIANEKAMAEAEQERALKLAELQRQRINEVKDPLVNAASQNLTDLATGQYKKGEFGKSLEHAGSGIAQSGLHKMMDLGLSKIPGLGGGKKDGSTRDLAFWVQMAGAGSPGSGEAPETGGLGGILGISHTEGPGEGSGEGGGVVSGAASGAGGLLGIAGKELAKIFGGSGGGSDSSTGLLAYGGPRAAGGGVEPGNAYKINENEQEYFVPSRKGSILPHPSSMGGGSTVFAPTIDARGSDLGVLNRINRAMDAAHADAVKTATHAMIERQKRTVARR